MIWILLVRVFPRSLVGLADLADFLRENSVKKVVMEPSDPYGLKVYSILESEDFDVWMVPAKDNKPRNQKKTDSEDAERLARGFVAGAVRAYKLPIDPKVKSLRRYVRTRKKLVEQLVAIKNAIIRIFDEACIDIKGVFGSIGKGALVFHDGYVQGRSLDEIIQRWPRLAKKRDKLESIMKAKLDDASIVALRSLLKIMKNILEEIDALGRHMENLLAEFGSDVDLLLTVPGVG